MAFCSHCGAKLVDGAGFCHICGAAVKEETFQNNSQRQQEYAGIILKCPNCGAVITETTVICPDCGMQITGRSAVSSVQAFQEQLMSIEMGRKTRIWDVAAMSANPTDVQKLALIRSFPIPNTVDDIREFILLALANIDVGLSAQPKRVRDRVSQTRNTANVNQKMQKTISDAWVSKMQQAYQKASMSFPNDSAFAEIQRVYFKMMKELNMSL